MAKLTKEELIAKVNESAGLSEEEKISFMEDITDSFEVEDNSELEQVKAELEAKTKEYDELVEKYKARFMSNEEVKEEKDEVEPEMEEKEYVDVKDIFTEEKKEDDVE